MINRFLLRKPSQTTEVQPAALEGLESRRLFAAAPVTITTLSNASEAGQTPGTFRISRTSTNRSASLTVLLQVGGSATYGADYQFSQIASGSQIAITIPANETSTLLRVLPNDDSIVEGTETVELTASLSDSSATVPHATMSIIDNDFSTIDQPVANINGPYRVAEGKAITLNGTATLAGNAAIQNYQWDFNYDGQTFDVDATGAAPVFNAAAIDGTREGVVRKIAFRVIDTSGAASTVATSTLTIFNVAPTAKLSGGLVRYPLGGTVRFSSPSDVAADVAAGFIYRYDFNNDGVIDLASHKSTAAVPASYLQTAGVHTIRATISDKDGGTSSYTTTVTVIRPLGGIVSTPVIRFDAKNRFSLVELA